MPEPYKFIAPLHRSSWWYFATAHTRPRPTKMDYIRGLVKLAIELPKLAIRLGLEGLLEKGKD